ncbi:fatty acid desaturase [Nitrosomonas sp. Is37]|uniref:fatty acid desaturase n=1 Tax=Nitrosomonas sp. Is37 TaxID=3080535 RepID=UPI00294B16FD|nr:fatty acid desaturase [Nitrosomonas sp. Is37]MDV6344957.1 fatty acid desaturase [Nitrosomonas sp. Is37]
MSKCLPPALLGDKNSLSDQARAEIQNLSGAQPIAFLFQILSAWGVIFAAITLAVYLDNIWMSLLVMVIVATRLSILALLVHEQVHFLGFRGRYGDLIVNLLAAYPLGITVEGYAKVHLSHHKHYFTENDPDFLRKSGIDWTFPMSTGRLIKLLASDLFSLSFIKLLKGKRLDNAHIFKRLYSLPKWVRPTFYIGVVAVFTYTEMWQVFLMYWLLPLLTIFPVFVRLWAISEHIYNLPGVSVIESSPLIILSWWEKLLLPNLNFTLHPYHHFYPGIAYCNLPKVHAIFQREQLVNEKNVFYGIWKYLKYLQHSEARSR